MNIQAIIVLAGGGQETDDIESLRDHIKLRLKTCRDIYLIEKHHNKDIKIIVSSAGTPHRKFFQDGNKIVYECDSMARYLIEKMHIPHKVIYREYISYDTIGNAFFTRHNFIDPMNIKKFLVITSKFHSKRTKVIFNFVFNKMIKPGFENNYDIIYKFTDNFSILPSQLFDRNEKEAKSIKKFREDIIVYKLNKFNNFFNWINENHDAYSTYGKLYIKVNCEKLNLLY